MNWYWPDWKNQKGWKRFKLSFLNWFLNYIADVIWFKRTNADLHDKSYEEGWTEAQRIRADTGFLRYLLIDSNWVWYKIILAYTFYFAVRMLWREFFNYK
jgi:hypothetical protein